MKQRKYSYCATHDTYRVENEPCWQCVNQLAQLHKEGDATEHQRLEAAESIAAHYKVELLSALAAIEKKNQMLLACAESARTLMEIDKTDKWARAEKDLRQFAAIEPDLSLLHQHDVEVRKPLMEYLNMMFALIDVNCISQGKRILDAALDQTKEQ